MIFDIVFLIFIGVAFWWGYNKGIIYSAFSLIGYFIGIFFSVKFSYIIVKYLKAGLDLSPKILSIIAFFLVFILIVLLVRIMVWVLEQVLKTFSLTLANQLAGGTVYALIGLYILCVLVWFGNKWSLIPHQEKNVSHAYRYISNLAPDVMQVSGKVIPVMTTTFTQFESLLSEEDTPSHENTAN